MIDSIRERSGGEIIKFAFEIYRENFSLLFFTYFVLAFPFGFLHELLIGLHVTGGLGSRPIHLALVLLGALSSFLAGILLTAIVSDIYLGYVPSLRRVLQRLSPSFLIKGLATEFLAQVAIGLGLLLLLIPGVVVYTLFMFYLPVFVIEGVWGHKALRRSIRLGRNYYLRNLSVMLLLYVIAILVVIIMFPLFVMFYRARTWVTVTDLGLKGLLLSVVQPILIIRTVILYYDMRIRNEAYDITAFAEELKR